MLARVWFQNLECQNLGRKFAVIESLFYHWENNIIIETVTTKNTYTYPETSFLMQEPNCKLFYPEKISLSLPLERMSLLHRRGDASQLRNWVQFPTKCSFLSPLPSFPLIFSFPFSPFPLLSFLSSFPLFLFSFLLSLPFSLFLPLFPFFPFILFYLPFLFTVKKKSYCI